MGWMLGRLGPHLALPVATAALSLGAPGAAPEGQKEPSAPTMSAVRIHAIGGRDVLRYETVDRPSPTMPIWDTLEYPITYLRSFWLRPTKAP